MHIGIRKSDEAGTHGTHATLSALGDRPTQHGPTRNPPTVPAKPQCSTCTSVNGVAFQQRIGLPNYQLHQEDLSHSHRQTHTPGVLRSLSGSSPIPIPRFPSFWFRHSRRVNLPGFACCYRSFVLVDPGRRRQSSGYSHSLPPLDKEARGRAEGTETRY